MLLHEGLLGEPRERADIARLWIVEQLMAAKPNVKKQYCPLHGVIFKCLASSQITAVLLILNKHNS